MKSDHPRIEWRRFADFSAEALYEVLRFRQAIFVVEQRSAYADLDGRDAAALHLLLRAEATLAGYLRLVPDPAAGRVIIGRVAVAPGSRHRGLARIMMQAALEAIARDAPAASVELSAQSYLVPFYCGLGFVPVSPPYDDCGVAHVDMALGR